MTHKYFSFLFFVILISFSCSSKDSTELSTDEGSIIENTKPNILLIIADDMGLDATPGYDIGNLKPNMPTLQSLMNSGIKFNNFWSNPTCSPTRATILTGKYGFRTGVTTVGDVLPTSETSIQSLLDSQNSGYNHAVIGKWHLSNDVTHPNTMGINYYSGFQNGGVQSYNNWTLVENGTLTSSTEYTTTKFTDLAIDWIGDQTQPWFLWLAYNAPHTPFHLPPNNLHSQGNLPEDQASIDANPLPYYLAMIEAMDHEMGRLINTLPTEELDNTIIIFIGDNGTPNEVVQEFSSNRAKGSLFQGGVNVPMVITGKNVERINAIENALINSTDLFATIADLAGTGITEINDSKSITPLLDNSNIDFREFVYSETGGSNYTIRNKTHKYISLENGNEFLYNLEDNLDEYPNLLNTNQLPLSEENEMEMNALIAKLNLIRN